MASKDEDANDNVRANHAAIKPQSQDLIDLMRRLKDKIRDGKVDRGELEVFLLEIESKMERNIKLREANLENGRAAPASPKQENRAIADQRDPPDSGNDGGHIILPEAGDGHAESSHQDGSAPTRDQCDTPGCRGHEPDELAPKLAIQCTACLEELPSIKMFQLTCKH